VQIIRDQAKLEKAILKVEAGYAQSAPRRKVLRLSRLCPSFSRNWLTERYAAAGKKALKKASSTAKAGSLPANS
jgi:hypothetical protein